MSILLTVNLKGGAARTTNAVAVAECLADLLIPAWPIEPARGAAGRCVA